MCAASRIVVDTFFVVLGVSQQHIMEVLRLWQPQQTHNKSQQPKVSSRSSFHSVNRCSPSLFEALLLTQWAAGDGAAQRTVHRLVF